MLAGKVGLASFQTSSMNQLMLAMSQTFIGVMLTSSSAISA